MDFERILSHLYFWVILSPSCCALYTAALLCRRLRRNRRHPFLCSYARTAACCSPRREIHYHDNGVHTVNVRRESYIADCYVTAAAAAGWIAHCGGGNQFRVKSVLSTPLSLRNSYWSSSECKEFKLEWPYLAANLFLVTLSGTYLFMQPRLIQLELYSC
jgi:hypothetical protein